MSQIREFKKLLGVILHMLTRAMKLTHAGVFLLEERSERYAVAAMRPRSHTKPDETLASDDMVIQWLKEEQAPLVREEISQLAHGQRNGSVLLSRLEEQLRQLGAAVVVPSFAEHRLIGFLVLGEKRTGAMYTQDDLRMLQTLANQAALAIENARFYEHEKERQAALFHTASLSDLGTMASSMSHQVNNRFNVVTVTASLRKEQLKQLLERNGSDVAALRKALEDDLEHFESLLEEGKAGGAIVQAIRKLVVRTQEGYKPLDICDAIQVGINVVQFKVDFDAFEFHQDVPRTLPKIMGDQAQLGEVFLNLIDNAWDAIKDKRDRLKPPNYRGEIRMTGSTITQPDPATKRVRPWLIIQVTDTGSGVKPEELNRLFIPFFTTKATAEKGTGLGLYVIKKIVEAHGGVIKAESTYRVGTTFTIQLPALEIGAHVQPAR